jgi:hypothetical protein
MEYSLLVGFVGEFNVSLHEAVKNGWEPSGSHQVTIRGNELPLITQMMQRRVKED